MHQAPIFRARPDASREHRHWGDDTRPPRQTAEDCVLPGTTDKRRNRAWRSDEVLIALDEFAARTGRRRLP
ncbi:MAG: hypothetical protein DLM59_16005 [Pseudonocardiales bacterium]|nr:MAG: hypothetical protein DLM59_16005 [Pseudonocardiales bacterium]